jgi:hypothetical protein
MATVTVSMDHLCTGNNHAHVDVNFDGTQLADVLLSRAEVMVPLTQAEATEILTYLVRIHCRGMNATQVRNALQAGWSMTI